ncbi:MAG TPA: YciI family protein [Ktedonobacteraceae bacterium]
MMRYLLLIYTDEAFYEKQDPEEQAQEYQEYRVFDAMAEKRGCAPQGEALQSISTATTVRMRENKILTTDGPFAETKEQLGGYYMLNCKDLDEAIEMATKIPGVRHGSIEIRPIMEFGM